MRFSGESLIYQKDPSTSEFLFKTFGPVGQELNVCVFLDLNLKFVFLHVRFFRLNFEVYFVNFLSIILGLVP